MIRFLQTPGPAKKIILGGLLLLICVAMVITLVPGGVLGGVGVPTGVLARVGEHQVTISDVQNEAVRIGRQQFPTGTPEQLMPLLRRSAAQTLILRSAMLEEADRLGLRVTDEELRQELSSGTYGVYFFPGGKFVGDEQYQAFVQENFNMTVQAFEDRMRQDILVRKLQSLVTDPITVTSEEVRNEFQRQNTQIKLEYALLRLEDLVKKVQPTGDELRAYFQENQAHYLDAVPEKRKAEYVVVSGSTVEDEVKISPEELREYYNEQIDRFRTPEEIKVRHILIRTPAPGPDGKVDEQELEEARKKAEEVLAKVRAGGDFAQLAREYSDDPGSAQKGGDLGWVGRGRTVPAFEQAAFALSKGQVSDLVKTTYGFHIIKVEDKREAKVRPLEEVADQLRPELRRRKGQQTARDLAETLETQARAQGLRPAAEARNLKVIETGFFTRTDSLPGLGPAPDFMSEVFGAQADSVPAMFALPDRYVVYKVLEVQPARTPTFEEWKEQVSRDFRTERARQMLGQKTAELSDRARALNDLKQAAREVGATVKTSDLVSISDQAPDLGQMSGPVAVAFEMQPGQISGPISLGASGAVVQVLERKQPPEEQFAQVRESLREEVLDRKRDQILQVFVNNLRNRMEQEGKIRVNQDEMNRLLQAGA